MTEPALPVATLHEAIPYLRRPFTVAAVKFRVLEGRGDRARCAAYIDARLVSERLNLVCPALWSHTFEPVPGGMRCDLTIDNLTRPDVGWSNGVATDIDLKALYSDAFKRAAVHFGVGVSLYAVPHLVLRAGQHLRKLEREGRKPAYYMQPAGETELRRVYAQWLREHGIHAFGEPFDHGDMEFTVSGTADQEDWTFPPTDVPAGHPSEGPHTAGEAARPAAPPPAPERERVFPGATLLDEMKAYKINADLFKQVCKKADINPWPKGTVGNAAKAEYLDALPDEKRIAIATAIVEVDRERPAPTPDTAKVAQSEPQLQPEDVNGYDGLPAPATTGAAA
jgi:hypothetical protein